MLHYRTLIIKIHFSMLITLQKFRFVAAPVRMPLDPQVTIAC